MASSQKQQTPPLVHLLLNPGVSPSLPVMKIRHSQLWRCKLPSETLITPIPKFLRRYSMGNANHIFGFPPLPAKLYHGNDKTHEISQDGKAIFVYRVSVSMYLHKRVNTRVDGVQVLKDIFGKIKAIDPTVMLVQVRNQGQETNYINEGVYIPAEKKRSWTTCPTASRVSTG